MALKTHARPDKRLFILPMAFVLVLAAFGGAALGLVWQAAVSDELAGVNMVSSEQHDELAS